MHWYVLSGTFAVTLAFSGFISVNFVEAAGPSTERNFNTSIDEAAGPSTERNFNTSIDESTEGTELSSPCRHNEDCLSILNAFCDESTHQCDCQPSFSPANSFTCGRLLGDDCHKGRCHADRTVCDTERNICICEFGLTPKPDNSSCHGNNFQNQLLYGDACDHDENCTSLGTDMKCIKGSCICKENFAYSELSCKEKVHELGAACNDMFQVCYDDNDVDTRICLAGRCTCKHYYISHNGTCKEKVSLLGAPCKEKSQACYVEADGSNQKMHCKMGVCQCKEDFLLSHGKCKHKIETLGEKCNYETDSCYRNADVNYNARSCVNGICQCNEGFVSVQGFCMQKIGLLGASCNVSTQLCYSNEDGNTQTMECVRGICQCKEGFVILNTKCGRKPIASARNAASRISLHCWKQEISMKLFQKIAITFILMKFVGTHFL